MPKRVFDSMYKSFIEYVLCFCSFHRNINISQVEKTKKKHEVKSESYYALSYFLAIDKKAKDTNNEDMKNFLSLLFLLLFSSALVFAAVVPQSSKVGKVCVEIKEGSVEEMVSSALKEEFSLSWIEKYCDESDAFLSSYSPLLSSILPMESIVMGEYDGNGISLYSQKNGVYLYLIIKEGKIVALQNK